MAKAVPILDVLLNATGITPADVLTVVDRHPRARGIRRLRDALELADSGAESPQETRVRLLLVGAGFQSRKRRLSFGIFASESIWGGASGRSLSSMTAYNTGKNRYQRSWDIERIALEAVAGLWSELVPRSCRGRKQLLSASRPSFASVGPMDEFKAVPVLRAHTRRHKVIS